MQTISTSIESIQSYYPVVVIGSGYGGSIAASRLARAGQKVCLLERGKEILPGQYPETLLEAAGQMQVHSAKGHVGSPTGLYDLHVHPCISVLVGCGLGGTSLINANVAIRPDDRVFDDLRWPKAIREEYNRPGSLLELGYARAIDMLRSRPLPDSIRLKKLEALQASAAANGQKCYRTPINVNFDIDGLNHVGVEQKPCTLCGDCCSGCNHSAKNTLLMNYLPDARNFGAEIFTEVSVRYLEKKGDTWMVHFEAAGAGVEKFKAPTCFVQAGMVVLSAGTLGSTEILLRSCEKGLSLSSKVGCNFSGNGDVLGFGFNTDHEVYGVGAGMRRVDRETAPGPCITGVIDLRDTPDVNEGMIIEDAAIPGPLAPILPFALAVEARLLGKNEEARKSAEEALRHEARILQSEIRGAYYGALKNTQTYLLMTHESDSGKFSLQADRLSIEWKGVGGEKIFTEADARLQEETKALGGSYIRNPVWIPEMNNELVSVHPLGGCFMGETVAEGVVNHKGQVFSAEGETGVYENLYVTDGSVVPRSLGANPLLTISALSERCCALMAADRGWVIDEAMPGKVPAAGTVKKVGIEFTETMRGFFSVGVTNDGYAAGFANGQASGQSFQFTLTIRSDDVYHMIADPHHEARMIGTVQAPILSKNPLTAEGVFQLFITDPDRVNSKLMIYRMKLLTEEGKTYFFRGFKLVHHNKGLDEWPETSTLYITIHDGDSEAAPRLGQGILHILPADFQKQMGTMKAVNAASKAEALKAVAVFGKYFARSLFEVYGGVFAPDEVHHHGFVRKKRDLRLCAPEYHPLKTEDGISVLLTRYRGMKDGTSKGPLLMVHGFSGNRLTFTIDTVDTNMAEYFYAHGYDVWLLDYRLSNLMPSAKEQHTVDEVAQFDYPAAVEKILSVTGAPQLDVLAHCVGSITVFMAMLNGLKGVRSIVSAQIASDFYPASYTGWKAALHVPDVLEAFGVKLLTAYVDDSAGWGSRIYDKFLKVFSVPQAGYCNDPTCHRMTFMFGPLYQHDKLNEATHSAMIEMFSVANMRTYKQLTRMMRARKLLDAKGGNVYMPHLDRLNIPITFIHGEKNHVFDPKSTLTTFHNLQQANGAHLYRHHIIPGYGHNDCMYGSNAVEDVYPIILNQFEAFYQ